MYTPHKCGAFLSHKELTFLWVPSTLIASLFLRLSLWSQNEFETLKSIIGDLVYFKSWGTSRVSQKGNKVKNLTSLSWEHYFNWLFWATFCGFFGYFFKWSWLIFSFCGTLGIPDWYPCYTLVIPYSNT